MLDQSANVIARQSRSNDQSRALLEMKAGYVIGVNDRLFDPHPHFRSIAIYGANASGKSNMVMAIQAMRLIVMTSAQYVPNQEIPIQPFMLDPRSIDAPTEFEITFMLGGVRYQYGFAVRKDRVTVEWLLVYRAPKPQVWFSRGLDEDNRSVYKLGSYFVGQKKVWEAAGLQLPTFPLPGNTHRA